MMRRIALSTALIAVALALVVSAQDTPPKDAAKKPNGDTGKSPDSVKKAETAKKDAPAKDITPKKLTHTVEKGLFKLEVSLKGILESEAMTEVFFTPESVTPDARAPLRVVKAVEHGADVHKGDQLIWFDTERIDTTITDLERDRELADLSFKLAHEDLYALEKTTPLDLAAAERSKKLADEDLKRYFDEEKDFSIKLINYNVKSASNYLLYAKEELEQLEKMYKSSDLTESTEKIILKRQHDYVEQATFYFKLAEHSRDLFFKVTLPRREESLKESHTRQSLMLDKTKTTLPIMLNQRRLTMEKLKFDRTRATERLEKLKKDREAMVLRAPVDGILYYGKSVRGNWSSGSMEGRLQRGGNVMPDEIIMTIVQPRPMFVRAGVDDKDFHSVKPGMKGKIVPTPLPDAKLTAKVDKVSSIPVSPGHFEARLSLGELNEPALMPGMACTVKLVAYQKSDALTIPGTALFTEENDEDAQYVYVQGKDDKATKVSVTAGKKSGTKVEILRGLKEGDQILLEKPADKKDPQPKKADQPKKGA